MTQIGSAMVLANQMQNRILSNTNTATLLP